MAGRPQRKADLDCMSTWSPARAATIYESIGSGVSLGKIAEVNGIGRWALTTWLEDPARIDLYKRARIRAASALAEQTIEIADGPETDGIGTASGADGDAPPNVSDVGRDKLRIQARQWLASRWDKDQYGERAQASVTINMATLHIDALRRAGPVAGKVIEAGDQSKDT